MVATRDNVGGMEHIGKRIKIEREARDWTQGDLAEAVRRINPSLRTKQTTIHSIEAGLSKNPTIVYELAKALGVTEQWLKTGRGPKEPSVVNANDQIETIWAAVLASYQMLGADDDEALTMLSLVQEVVGRRQAHAQALDHEQLRQLLLKEAARKFLKSKPHSDRQS